MPEVNLFPLLSRYFWLVCLATSFINYLLARRRMRAATTDPRAVEEGEQYMRRFALAAALPWALMGLGQMSGITPTIWYYFRPQDLNPFVTAWFACIFVASVIHAGWVLSMDGAEKIRRFDLWSAAGVRGRKPKTDTFIKLMAAAGPFFILLWIALVVSMDAPIPK